MSWFCIGTNVACMIPAYMLYNRKYIPDAFITVCTGVASFMFHGAELEGWPVGFTPMRNTDVILANLLVLHTINTLLHTKNRFGNSLCMLPPVIYGADVKVFWRFVVLCLYGAGCSIYIFTNRNLYILKWYIIGLSIIVGEIFLFTFGNQKENEYSWYHGAHHIAAFTAQGCFVASLLEPS